MSRGHNKPTKDKIERRRVHTQFSRETLRHMPHIPQVASQVGLTQLKQTPNEWSQVVPLNEAQPGVLQTEVIRPGPMCLQALVQSPHFQAYLEQVEARAA